MKKILYIIIACCSLSCLQANPVIIVPRNQQNYYYQAPPPYYYPPYYTPYEPDNGPMRGPNSIEGHKSYREQNRDWRSS